MHKGTWIATFAIALVGAFSLQSMPRDAAEAVSARATMSELRMISQLRQMAQPPDDAALRMAVAYAPQVPAPAVAAAPAVSAVAEDAGETLVVTAEALNLRAQPSNGAAVLERLMQGQKVAVSRRKGGWIEVAAADGTTGWAYGAYLAEAMPN